MLFKSYITLTLFCLILGRGIIMIIAIIPTIQSPNIESQELRDIEIAILTFTSVAIARDIINFVKIFAIAEPLEQTWKDYAAFGVIFVPSLVLSFMMLDMIRIGDVNDTQMALWFMLTAKTGSIINIIMLFAIKKHIKNRITEAYLDVLDKNYGRDDGKIRLVEHH